MTARERAEEACAKFEHKFKAGDGFFDAFRTATQDDGIVVFARRTVKEAIEVASRSAFMAGFEYGSLTDLDREHYDREQADLCFAEWLEEQGAVHG